MKEIKKQWLFLNLIYFLLFFSCGGKKESGSVNNGVGEPCQSVLDCKPGLGCYEGKCYYPDASLKDITEIEGSDNTFENEDSQIWAEDEFSIDILPESEDEFISDIEEDDGGGEEVCMFRPPVGEFRPHMECMWSGSEIEPNKDDVVATPVVANLTDDNGDTVIDLKDIPDIVFISYDLEEDGCCAVPGAIRVVSGRCRGDGTMQEHFTINYPVDNSGGLAVGDIDGDTLPEIVAMRYDQTSGRTTGTVAFENDGTLKWESDDPGLGANLNQRDTCTAVQPSIADLDGDTNPEIIVGRVVLDGATGITLWKGTGGRGFNAFLGPIGIAADIDLDGIQEVIAGNTVYRADGWIEWVYDYGSSLGSCAQGCSLACDGFNATGNFDEDDYAEIVSVVAERVFIFEHDGTMKYMFEIPRETGYTGYNEGGPPTVADFDGDGKPEIGVAAANYYAVFDTDCTTGPLPSYCDSYGIRWKVPNNDESSRVTGSSVFDFDGDGSAEVIYNDETNFRIFRGSDGEILFEEENHSHTRLEYPVIADVDNDGNAEIVFIENRGSQGATANDHGIQIWGDYSDNWVPTRRIWNQHAYHITNVNEDGTIPSHETPNWLIYNNYRQNLPDFSPFLAPDLTIEFVDAQCENQQANLRVRVCNIGDNRVGEVEIRFYDGDPASGGRGIDCDSSRSGMQGVKTEGTLEPDDCEVVTCLWTNPPIDPESSDVTACVDDSGPDWSCTPESGLNNECNENNNKAIKGGVQCERPI